MMRKIRCPKCSAPASDIRLHGVVELGFEFLYADETWTSSDITSDPDAVRVEGECLSCENTWRLRGLKSVAEIDPAATIPDVFQGAPPSSLPPEPESPMPATASVVATKYFAGHEHFQNFDGVEATAFHVVTSRSPEKWDNKNAIRFHTAGVTYRVCSGTLVREGDDVFFRFSPQGAMIQRRFLVSTVRLDPQPHFKDTITKSDLHVGIGHWNIPTAWIGYELAALDPDEVASTLEAFSDGYRATLLSSMLNRIDPELLRDEEIWESVAGTLSDLA